MKMIRLAFAVIVSIIICSTLEAQTVDDIINKHIEAIGGKENIGKVKSIYEEGTMDMMGTSAPLTITMLDGKGFKSELNYNGSVIVNVITDKGGWNINPLGGNPSPTPLTDEMFQSQKTAIYTGGILLDYASKGAKAELVGVEEGAYKVKVTTSNAPIFLFIDSSTYYIKKKVVKGELMGESMDVTTSYSDFKKTDAGIVLPYSQVLDIGQYTLPSTFSKIEFNKPVDAAIFEMPK